MLRFTSQKMYLLFSLLLLSITASASAQTLVSQQSTKRAAELLKQMTLEEKIGQLNQAGALDLAALGIAKPDDLVAAGRVGSILWLTDVKEINRLQHLNMEKSRLHIPIIFAFDVIHGYRTIFPIPIGMASSWDPSVEEAAQHEASQDARVAGIRWTFTPMVDIARDARWGRMAEGAGEDPYLGAAMARAQVRGIQGETLGPKSILACVKHFAGYGAAEGGRDYDSSYIADVLLENVYLPPFHAAEQAGAATFMSAYMDLNDVPATGNHWLMTETLRNEWGFKGFLVSDAFAVASLEVHGYARDAKDAALKAFSAGLNMDMASETYTQNLGPLVAEGKITEKQINAAVLPILELKYQLGLFENPYVDETKVEEQLNRPEELALERKLAARSMVLLKNENHTLPLGKNQKHIAVIGPLADSVKDIEGSWTVENLFGASSKSHPVTILAGIRNKLGADADIEYVPGPTPSRKYYGMVDMLMKAKTVAEPSAEETAEWLAKTKAAAANADLIVAVLGETADMSGEAHSRATLELPGIQEQMLEVAAGSGKPVVLVLENARPLDIRWAAKHVAAILEAWYPGTEGGNAAADVLFGDVNPGGKLPISWPLSVGQEPIYYNHNLTHEPEDKPGFTSRYWDLSSKPLYPFGYGLSYTQFKFENLRLSNATIKAGASTTVQVDVTNTGAVAGDEVAQLYIHQKAGAASRPIRQLKGFKRITLAPGEKQTVSFELGKDELTYWNPASKSWSLDPGAFDLWAGEDSTATMKTSLTISQ